jgi:hypothetical protein
MTGEIHEEESSIGDATRSLIWIYRHKRRGMIQRWLTLCSAGQYGRYESPLVEGPLIAPW